jgi:hypothetical protein
MACCATRPAPPRIAPLAQAVIDHVVALTATEPPHEATHWTAAAMAKLVGISGRSAAGVGTRPARGADRTGGG